MESGLTLLSQAHLPPLYWVHVFLTTVYLIDILPVVVLDFNIPFESIMGRHLTSGFPSGLGVLVFLCSGHTAVTSLIFVQRSVHPWDTLPIIMAIEGNKVNYKKGVELFFLTFKIFSKTLKSCKSILDVK